MVVAYEVAVDHLVVHEAVALVAVVVVAEVASLHAANNHMVHLQLFLVRFSFALSKSLCIVLMYGMVWHVM